MTHKEIIKEFYSKVATWDYRLKDPFSHDENYLFKLKHLIEPKGSGIYLFKTVDTSFNYLIGDSKTYYIGKMKNFYRLEKKLSADNKKANSQNPRLKLKNRTIYHHPSSTAYDLYSTDLLILFLPEKLQKYYKECEDIVLGAFILKYGLTPMTNRQSPNAVFWSNSNYTAMLLEIAERLEL